MLSAQNIFIVSSRTALSHWHERLFRVYIDWIVPFYRQVAEEKKVFISHDKVMICAFSDLLFTGEIIQSLKNVKKIAIDFRWPINRSINMKQCLIEQK